MQTKFQEYDAIELKEDLSVNLKKGMRGTILMVFDENKFEVEILDKNGVNIHLNNQNTFTVDKSQIKKIK